MVALELPAAWQRGQFYKLFASFADRRGVATAGFVFYLADNQLTVSGGVDDDLAAAKAAW